MKISRNCWKSESVCGIYCVIFFQVCLKCWLLFNRTRTRVCTRAWFPAPQESRAGVGCWLSEVLRLKLATVSLSVTLHTLSLLNYTSFPKKQLSLPVFFIGAQSVASTRQSTVWDKMLIKLNPLIWCNYVFCVCVCFCNERWRFFSVQSFWVHPASRTSTEACHNRGDQKHSHPHLAVQSPWRRGRCHLLHYRSLQVSFQNRSIL